MCPMDLLFFNRYILLFPNRYLVQDRELYYVMLILIPQITAQSTTHTLMMSALISTNLVPRKTSRIVQTRLIILTKSTSVSSLSHFTLIEENKLKFLPTIQMLTMHVCLNCVSDCPD